jgi:glycosyltransferase involved in cell wall biosynthesis
VKRAKEKRSRLAGAKLQSSRLRPETYFVSVIVPTHDRHDLVGRAIRSVLCQTYRSWELIIVNDGSTDRTAEVLSSYGDDPRIRVMHLDPARGGAAARNVGLDLATGELIAFLDDDDVWLPTKLEKQVALLDSRSDVDIVSCNFLRVGDASSSIVRIDGEYTAREIMAFNVLGSFSFCVVRRQAIGDIRIDERLRACQDWSLWLAILMQRERRAVALREVLVEYDDTSKPCLTKNWRRATRSYVLFLQRHWRFMPREVRAYHLARLRLRRLVLGGQVGVRYALGKLAIDVWMASQSARVRNVRRYFVTTILYARETLRKRRRLGRGRSFPK